ncbi:MAG TPA: PKD domain-containing protein, partial [Candidatus Sulfotelmatobacter sp.]|nr:PKD domain-containing protein [Candidatus Sulfotelmatobacter sp.]
MRASAYVRSKEFALLTIDWQRRLLRRIWQTVFEHLRGAVALLLVYATVAATMPVQAHELDREFGTSTFTAGNAKLERDSRPLSTNYRPEGPPANLLSRNNGFSQPKSSSNGLAARIAPLLRGSLPLRKMSGSLPTLTAVPIPTMAPPPGSFFTTSSISANFNGTAIAAGDYVWFSSVLKPSGLGSKAVTFFVRSATITFSANGTNYSVPVPDANITFDPKATTATTNFNSAVNQWQTTVPATGQAGNTLLDATEFLVPAGGLPGGIKNVTWTANFSTDTSGASLQWQWAAAAYTSFTASYGSVGIKPVDDNKASQYQNSDHAGTPENYKSHVVGGATGGGASNYTGSYSGTASVTPVVVQPPVANAGNPQTVYVGTTVTLNGSNSTDPQGLPLSYQWSTTSGSTAGLNGANSATPTVVAQSAGTYTWQVIVSDGYTSSTPSTVTITSIYSTPVANAGSTQTDYVGATIHLDGTLSYDPTGLPLTYAWTFTSRPAGSTATLSGATTAAPAFVADKAGNYTAQLVVSNGYNNSPAASVTITAQYSTPLANAGPPQTLYVGSTVQLDGTGSSDPAGLPLTYQWSLTPPAGSTATLSGSNGAKPTFVLDKTGTYTAKLTVSNAYTSSTPSTVTITSQNLPPIANAGQPQSVYQGQTVQLNGSGSTDPAGLPITYQWSFASRPDGSNATLAGATTPTPTFIADKSGKYIVQLIVNNGVFDSTPSTVTITTSNAPPVANAGPNQSVAVHTTVQLDGSGSTDVDGDSLTYSWSFVSVPTGSKAAFSNPNVVNPTFFVDLSGNYVAQLIVNDGSQDSTGSTVAISTINTPPVANAGPNQTITVTGTVQLDGSGSTDVDGNPITYSWVFLSVPAGSHATLVNPNAVNPTFMADVLGMYIVQLTVNDGIVNSTPATVTISSSDVPPIANPGLAQTANVGSIVNLDGSASSDSDNQPLTYQWALINKPVNSTAALSQATSATPYFTADILGNYIVQLTVNDGFLSSNPATVLVSTIYIPPVANAGADQTVTAGATVQLSGAASADTNGNPLTYSWAILSQPSGGTAVLSDATSVSPTFVANAAGMYVVQLTVNDGTADSQPVTMKITANPQNQAPVVNGGPNQSITLPINSVTLNGTASDDGLPNNTLTISWSVVSGPGTVTFSSPSTPVTQATFSLAGTYVLQLTANDSQLSTSANTTVTVNPAVNQAPVVNAGPNQNITLPANTVTLNGTATDDGLPNGTLNITWSVVSGPGTVSFGSPHAAITQATFSTFGVYVLQLTANDTQLSTSATTIVTVAPPAVNQPPVVNAGPNQAIMFPASTVTLNGTATDDGLPNGTLAVSWSQISGPTTATFNAPNTAATQVNLTAPGVYVLQLSASDTQYASTSQVTVYVYTSGGSGQNQPPYVNAGPDQTILLPTSAQLNGVAVDDGLPNGTLAIQWTMLSGPGTVTFSNPNAAVTQASFSMAGTYVLQLAANDSVLVSNSSVTITVGKLNGHASNAGTDFWLMFPECQGACQPELIIASDVNNSGSVSVPGLSFTQNFTLVGGHSTTINLPTSTVLTSTDLAENKGIHVTSQSEVTVFAIDYLAAETDGYLGLPTSVLGTDYVVPSWQHYNAPSEFGIVAAYDGTTVTITPSVGASGRAVGQPYTVILNQGRTYELTTDPLAIFADLTGTIVTSDKPIAVFGANACANIPTSASFCNHVIEEIPPTNLWGQSFVTFPLVNRPNGDFFRVLASVNNTNVNMNGSPLATLNRGEYYQTVLTAASTITADQPILVVQYETSESYQPASNNQEGDPSMILVPPYEQNGGHYTVGTPASGFNTDYVNLVVPTTAVGTVQLDGTAVSSSNFSVIGSSSYSGAAVQISPGTHRFTAAAPFGVTLYGYYPYDTFGYQAGMVLDTARAGTTVALTPSSVTQLTGTQLCAVASVLDPYGAAVGGVGVGFTVTGANTSSQTVDTTATGQASYCYSGTNSGTDTILASVGLASATSTITWSASAPNRAPAVYAGGSQIINLPAVANLYGVVSDDGLPSGGTLSLSWTRVSGPGNVTFANAAAAVTTATFSVAGTYDLRFTANDSQLSASADVTITAVTPAQNQAPVVSAGPNQSASLPANIVTLNGSASDDGLPANAKLTVQWTQVSGPTGAVISNSTSPLTQVTFTNPGTYVFQLTANDSQLQTSSQVTVTVVALNKAPQVSCSSVPSVTLPVTTTTLSCTVTDDGLPQGSTVTQTWSELSGPAAVTFTNPTAGTTNATFPVAGTYSLQLTAYDTQLTANSAVTVVVNPASQPPTVTISPSSQTIALPTITVTLTGTVTDSVLPPGGSLSQSWSEQSGAAGVTFGSPTQATTTVTFTAAGTYTLLLTASNTQMVGSATATVVVTGGSTVTNPNQAPHVSAGLYNPISLPTNSLTLQGTVTDDGLPSNTLTINWSQVAGPAAVTFNTPNQASSLVTFPVAGTYRLRLSANDTQLTSTADTVMTVNASDLGPKVSFSPTLINLIYPATSTTLSANITANPGTTLAEVWTEYSGPEQVVFSSPNSATTQVTFPVPGFYVFQLAVSDGQYTGTGIVNVQVYGSAPAAPQVTLVTPQDAQTVTAPVNVIGSVIASSQSSGTNQQTQWTLDYSLNTADGLPTQTWIHLAQPSGSVPQNNAVLGVLDPTVMLNGSYTLRLSVTDSYGQSATTTTSFVVSKNMKVGNFRLTYNDLTVPVAGIPITVTRIYDSLDQGFHDFGTSWSLGIANVQLQKNRNLGKNWTESSSGGGFSSFCVQSLSNAIVTITFPGNTQYNFQAVSTPQCQSIAPITATTVGFVELPGSAGTAGATLVPADGGQVLFDGPVPGNMNLVDYNANPYNPTVFVLTTRDGMKYTIDQKLGVTNMSDANGNTLTISSSGVISSTGKSISFTRDSSNRITKITDPNGNVLKYAYNGTGANSQLSQFTDAVGNTSSYFYTINGVALLPYLNQILDPRNVRPILQQYDNVGHLTLTYDANNKTISYNLNESARTDTITDRLGNPTLYAYDADGNILLLQDALGNKTTYTYDTNDNKLSETNPLGKTTTYTYDGDSNRTSETDPLGNKTSYTYNARGQVLTVTDPLGHTTTNVYDSNGNLTSTTDANGKTTSTVYTANGLPKSVTDANGKTTQFQYDGSGNLTQQTDALNNITTYTYDLNNNKLSQTVTRTVNGQPQTITTNYKYDASNRLTETDYADGTKTQIQYNNIGKQSATIDQLNHKTSYTYDNLGRLTTTTYADTTTETATFDEENDRLTSVDRAGHTTSYAYDADKRLTKTTYADQSFTQTNYDAAGRVSSTVDANNNTTTYGYDDAGRRTTLTDALNHVTTFAYDNAGNQISVKDARQNLTQYQYDTLNRQTAVIYPDQSSSSTAYDNLGRVVSKTDQAGKVTAYGYDA